MVDGANGLDIPYPGTFATPDDLLALATHYERAADILREQRRKGEPLSLAPFRLTAIHSIELYLSAFLLAKGMDTTEVRGMQHDLGARSTRAKELGLVLRRRTAEHLDHLAEIREYLAARYGPELIRELSQVNRLAATLDEVSAKVRAALASHDSDSD